ncbi:MAG: hypothetical protein LBE76_08705 [Nitrososphaerota archaeon]|nr:hypothetical protein [Nitrososphaerota archaeon]
MKFIANTIITENNEDTTNPPDAHGTAETEDTADTTAAPITTDTAADANNENTNNTDDDYTVIGAADTDAADPETTIDLHGN